MSAAESGECGIYYASIQRVEVDERIFVAIVQSVRGGDVMLYEFQQFDVFLFEQTVYLIGN